MQFISQFYFSCPNNTPVFHKPCAQFKYQPREIKDKVQADLPLIKRYAVKTYGKLEGGLHLQKFLTSVLDKDEPLASRSGRLSQG
jgi:hypothetical protein